MKPIRKIFGGLFILGGFVTLLNLLHAQETETSIQVAPLSLTPTDLQAFTSLSEAQVTALVSALDATPTISADALPKSGTYWSLANPAWPPLPGNFHGFSVWAMDGGNSYLLNDVDFDYNAEIQSVATRSGMRMMSLSGAPGFDDLDTNGVGTNTNSYFSSFFIDTNRLWLEITNVSGGLADLNLHRGTNQVYAIWVMTNLLTDWRVALELWPTNPAVQAFTVPTLGRDNVFVRAEDWTGVDSNGDGIPDWWIWNYYGELSETATNLDVTGHTLLFDYTNNIVTNVFAFSGIEVTNNYVRSSSVPVQLDVAGYPYFIAVLVDDTNFAGAVWNDYTASNLTVNLGLTEGGHDVWVGLRGHGDDPSAAVWRQQQLNLDSTAPTLVITSPASGTVSVSRIQLLGYSPEGLSGISYDLTNAAGVFTNQAGYLAGQVYDTNVLAFTTNYFQCYDVPLAAGANVITLHAADLAGNSAMVTVNYTLDYSTDHTAPALTVTWPPDGTDIVGTNFTVEAQVDDPTATVTATLVDADDNITAVSGLVDRDGTAWLKNLPLAEGASTLTVTTTDAAGNTNRTSLTVYQSSVTVTMDAVDEGQLNGAAIDVSGTVSDPTARVYVNGVQADVNSDDGTWIASGVPLAPGYQAVFNLAAYPAEDSGGGGGGGPVTTVVHPYALPTDASPTGLQLVALPKPPVVQVVGFHESSSESGEEQELRILTGETDFLITDGSTEVYWTEGIGGKEHDYGTTAIWHYYPAFPEYSYFEPARSFDNSAVLPTDVNGANAIYPMPMEHGAIGNGSTLSGTVDARTALKTGGLVVPGQENLYLVKVRVQDVNGDPVPVSQVQVPGWTLTPDTLDTNWGDFLVTAPAQATVPMTPVVPGMNYYTFAMQATNVTLTILDASGTDLTAQTNTVIVGQQMNLHCQLSLTNALLDNSALSNFQWAVPGYAISNYVVAVDSSTAMVVTNFPLNNTNVVFYWVDGASNRVVQCSAMVNGATVTAQAVFNIYRPSVTFTDEPPSWATNAVIDGTFSLSLGDDNDNGAMKYEADISSQYSGKADLTQLINRSAANGNTSDSTSGQYWLDKYVFYTVQSDDPTFPHNVLTNAIFRFLQFDAGPCFELAHSVFGNTTSIFDQFKDYVMFRPKNGTESNNIYVPLGKITWSWSAATTYSGGAWSTPTYSITRPGIPDGGYEFPQWLHTYH